MYFPFPPLSTPIPSHIVWTDDLQCLASMTGFDQACVMPPTPCFVDLCSNFLRFGKNEFMLMANIM
jgi:hypothetical protein